MNWVILIGDMGSVVMYFHIEYFLCLFYIAIIFSEHSLEKDRRDFEDFH